MYQLMLSLSVQERRRFTVLLISAESVLAVIIISVDAVPAIGLLVRRFELKSTV